MQVTDNLLGEEQNVIDADYTTLSQIEVVLPPIISKFTCFVFTLVFRT